MSRRKMPVHVFDFFCGCGGTSTGFAFAGMEITFALDNDPDAAATFRQNHPCALFLEADIRAVSHADFAVAVDRHREHLLLFSGCAPCQPFTRQRTKRRRGDPRRSLLSEFQRLVLEVGPDLVFVENVPGLQRVPRETGPFAELVRCLRQHDYHCVFDIVRSQDYGVPQMRRRLVLLASRLGPIGFPPRTHGPHAPNHYATVRDAIAQLPPITAGTAHATVADHAAMRLSPQNLARVRAIPPEGSRKSLPPEMQVPCHFEHAGHTDVYGRMRWDAPASGLTTRCISLSNGRFGHPEQDRAISVREAACLQTFPMAFRLHGSLSSKARQIGNAVPVQLARVFGEHFVRHAREYGGG